MSEELIKRLEDLSEGCFPNGAARQTLQDAIAALTQQTEPVADQVNTDTVSVPRDEVDTGAIAWAIKKLHAFGVAQNNQENAMMADRLEAMLRAAQEGKK